MRSRTLVPLFTIFLHIQQAEILQYSIKQEEAAQMCDFTRSMHISRQHRKRGCEVVVFTARRNARCRCSCECLRNKRQGLERLLRQTRCKVSTKKYGCFRLPCVKRRPGMRCKSNSWRGKHVSDELIESAGR